MSEGLSGTDVGKELAEHAKHSRGHDVPDRRDRLLAIAEAVLLSLVTLAAAWSGFAAAKWNGESAELMTLASERGRRRAGRTLTRGRTVTLTCPPLRPGSTRSWPMIK